MFWCKSRSLIPIAPGNDGDEIHKELAQLLASICGAEYPDVIIGPISAQIVVAFDLYNKEGLDACLNRLKYIRSLILEKE